ncbi:MAG: GGDEF domain-containing protein [Pseudonocardiaceae bacterium]
MSDQLGDTRFAFQSLVNLQTGGVVAVELLARPPHDDVRALLSSAARAGRLVQLDVAMAVAAAQHSSRHETLLPIHLNLLADTVSDERALEPLDRTLHRTGRRPAETVLEINPPYGALEPELLLAGMRRLRRRGYRIALDGVGAGDYPLTVIAHAEPDVIKMDREIVAGLPDDRRAVAVLEALQHLCPRIDAQLVAEGVERPEQLATLRQYGVGIAQGNLFDEPSRRPSTSLPISSRIGEMRTPASPGPAPGPLQPRITDFAHPAITLPAAATAEEVRDVLARHTSVTGVILVDGDGRPRYSLDRNRFLLAVSGAYGHALHARRDAARLADPPRVLASGSSALAALDLIGSSDPQRMYDDIVVVDPDGRCAGVVRIGDVVRGVAEANAERAVNLHPLTRLPGSDAVAEWVDGRVAGGEIFVVSWLDVDGFGAVNDSGGFTAGDDLIRELGNGLVQASELARSAQIAHIGADHFVAVNDLDDVVPFGSAVLDLPWSAEGGPVAFSMASLVCAPGTVAGHREVSRTLAGLRRQAKDIRGTSWVFGRPGSDRVDVVRGLDTQAARRIS